jgi:hypothetical protein
MLLFSKSSLNCRIQQQPFKTFHPTLNLSIEGLLFLTPPHRADLDGGFSIKNAIFAPLLKIPFKT